MKRVEKVNAMPFLERQTERERARPVAGGPICVVSCFWQKPKAIHSLLRICYDVNRILKSKYRPTNSMRSNVNARKE